MAKNKDTTIIIDTGAWKVKIVLGTVGILAVVILAFMFRFEAGLIMLGGGTVAVWRGVVWVNSIRRLEAQNTRRMEAETRRLELETDIVAEKLEQERHKTDEFQLRKLIIETKVGVFRFPKPDPATNPVYIPASAGERKALETGLVIDAQAQPLDFFMVMSDPKAVYALIGPQRVGKSYIAMHLADYLASRGLGTNLVIGTKMEPGEWSNCKRFIGEEAINRALPRLIATIDDRHNRNVREPRINLFLDDWINLVAVAGGAAETLFLRAATDMLAAGIVPYFMLQSDSNQDWGNRYGATLKNNFVKLILKAARHNGVPVPSETQGFIIWPGERDERPVNLPRGLPQLGPPQQPVTEPPLSEPEAAKPDPAAEADTEFVRLVKEKKMSRRKAALEAYKRSYAGDIVDRAKRALGEI